MNRFTVLLFARYAELFGAEQVEVELPANARVADLISALRSLPGGDVLPVQPLIAVNLSQSHPGATLHAGDEVAVLPPLAGG